MRLSPVLLLAPGWAVRGHRKPGKPTTMYSFPDFHTAIPCRMERQAGPAGAEVQAHGVRR